MNAWQQLRHRSATMDTLVALSTGIAYLFSLFNLVFRSSGSRGEWNLTSISKLRR